MALPFICVPSRVPTLHLSATVSLVSSIEALVRSGCLPIVPCKMPDVDTCVILSMLLEFWCLGTIWGFPKIGDPNVVPYPKP